MKEELLFRQGDVLAFRLIDGDKPETLVPATLTGTGDLVIATGSSNGHKHQIRNLPAVGTAQSEPNTRNVYVDLTADATLVHEEHGPINLPAGTYRLGVQSQYAPGDIRNVED